MILQNREDTVYSRLSRLIREIRFALINPQDSNAEELMKMLIYPDIQEAKAASLTKSELREKVLKPDLVSLVPSVRVQESLSRIVIYLDLSSLDIETSKFHHTINVDVVVPRGHWLTSDGPKPLLIMDKISKIMRNISYDFTGLGKLTLIETHPLVLNEEEIGYTLKFALLDFSE